MVVLLILIGLGEPFDRALAERRSEYLASRSTPNGPWKSARPAHHDFALVLAGQISIDAARIVFFDLTRDRITAFYRNREALMPYLVRFATLDWIRQRIRDPRYSHCFPEFLVQPMKRYVPKCRGALAS